VLREQAVNAAQAYSQQQSPPSTSSTSPSLDQSKKNVQEALALGTNLPIGWTENAKAAWSQTPGNKTEAIIGWLITAIAASFGAPFWFDFVNRTLGLNARLSGSKPKAND